MHIHAEGYRPHSLIILRGIIVSYQRHKALAEAHGDIQRELIDSLYNAVGRHRNVAVAGSQMHHDHIGGIAESCCQSGRQPHREDRPGKPERKVLRKQGNRAAVSQAHVDDDKNTTEAALENAVAMAAPATSR